MSKIDAQIREKLQDIATAAPELQSGTVVPGSVNLDNYTVSVLLTGFTLPLPGVILGTISGNGNGCIPIPADNSDVVIACIDGPGVYCVVKAAVLDKVLVKAGNTTLVIDDNGLVINGGSNGGVPVTPQLVQRLNQLEQDINTLKAAFSAWTPVTNDGGAALKAAAANWIGQTLTATVAGDIENTAFKQ